MRNEDPVWEVVDRTVAEEVGVEDDPAPYPIPLARALEEPGEGAVLPDVPAADEEGNADPMDANWIEQPEVAEDDVDPEPGEGPDADLDAESTAQPPLRIAPPPLLVAPPEAADMRRPFGRPLRPAAGSSLSPRGQFLVARGEDAERTIDGLEMRRPAMLSEPRNGVPDNLQRIRGIGERNEVRLNRLGIFHFSQIASWTPAEIRWIGQKLAFPERIERDDWVGQAIVLASGGETGFTKSAERRRERRRSGRDSDAVEDDESVDES
jgi:predicted flap endonuclease-1-like 5' DNA nuclease